LRARRDVKKLREEKERKEHLIAMALGRHDLRATKYTLHRWTMYTHFSKNAKRVLYCYRAHIAKTIVWRMKERREKRRKAIMAVFAEYRRHMFMLGLDKMQEVVRASNAAEVMQRFVRRELKRIRTKRVALVSIGAGSVLMGLTAAVVVRRWTSGVKINRLTKMHFARAVTRTLRAKRIREAEILTRCKVVRERRIVTACNAMWREMMVVWKDAYGVMQRSWRCALARRERLRRIEYERLLLARLDVYLASRRGRLLTRVWQGLEGQVIEKMVGTALGKEGGGRGEVQEGAEADEKKEDAPTTPRASRLPAINLVANQISLESTIYTSPNSLKSTSYALSKHMDRSRSDIMSHDSQSLAYWSAFKKVKKTGIFEMNCDRKDDMTKADRGLLVRACHVFILKGAAQAEMEELGEVLEGCWSDDDDETQRGVVSLRKVLLVGRGSNTPALDPGVLEKLFFEALKKTSKIVSFSMTDMDVGNAGVLAFAKVLAAAQNQNNHKKLCQLQELTFDNVNLCR
jgi:hypothetical protein